MKLEEVLEQYRNYNYIIYNFEESIRAYQRYAVPLSCATETELLGDKWSVAKWNAEDNK